MFDKAWFLRNQRELLFILNNPLTRDISRSFFRIDGRRSDVGNRKILRIYPNAILWREESFRLWDVYSAEFRTHDKFAKLIYYNLLPFWKLCHLWDINIANRLFPNLNLGFDTTGNIYPAAGSVSNFDGFVKRDNSSDDTWSQLRDGAGTHANITNTGGDAHVLLLSSATSDRWRVLTRSVFCFNMTVMTLDISSVDSAVFSYYATNKDYTLGAPSPEYHLSGVTPAASDNLVPSDFGNFQDTSYGYNSYASLPAAGSYGNITLNSNGLNYIKDRRNGVVRFGARLNYDINNSAPGWTNAHEAKFEGYFADAGGTANDPKLVVTFTPAVYGAML